jgi:hypothetical protein
VTKAKSQKNQSEKFKQAARELGCDENEEAVDELMKRVARKAPPRKPDKPPAK